MCLTWVHFQTDAVLLDGVPSSSSGNAETSAVMLKIWMMVLHKMEFRDLFHDRSSNKKSF